MLDREGVSLPKIVRFLETLDCPGASCPHCGATGRFILRFMVADGRQLGAMRGCVQLFPVSPIAREEKRLADKAKKYYEQGWKLNQADTRAVEAIESFYAGLCTEDQALREVKLAKRSNTMRFRR